MDGMDGMDGLNLKELVKADQARRLAACQAAIAAALEEHRCELTALPAITPDGRITAQVGLRAAE